MRIQDFILAPKEITALGKWHCGLDGKEGRMKPGTFALSQRRSVIFGAAWRWKLDQMICAKKNVRLLIAYRADTEQYQAMLAIENEKSLTVVAALEFHGDHAPHVGWHVHTRCGHVEKFTHTCTRQRVDGVRLPGARSLHRRNKFVANDAAAAQKAYDFFGIGGKQAGGLL